MPYILKEAQKEGKKGFKVCKKDEPKRCFSKNPLPKETAQKQRTAIILSEMRRSASASAASAAAGKKTKK